MSVLLALLPVLAIVVSMSVLNLGAAPACGIGLSVSVLLGVTGFSLPLSSVAPTLLHGVLSSWDLVFLIAGGSLMGAVLTANGTTGALSAAFSEPRDFVSEHDPGGRLLLAGTCLGVIPAVSALIGPGAYFVGIPLLLSMGVPAARAIPVFLLSQAWGLPNFTFGLPCTAMSASTGIPAREIARSSNLPIVLLIVVGALMLRVFLPELRTVCPANYAAVAGAAIAGALLGSVLGPAFPTLIGGVSGTIVALALHGDRSMPARLKGISFTKILPVVLMMVHSVVARIPAVEAAIGRVVLPVSTPGGTVTFDFLGSSGFMLLMASLLGCLTLPQGERRKCLKKSLRNWDAVAVAPIAISLASTMRAAGMLARVVEATTSLGRAAFALCLPLIGMLGHYVTGSLVSGSLVAGRYIVDVAASVGISPALAAAVTLAGGAPIVILVPSKTAMACAAAQYKGEQRSIIRRGLLAALVSWLAMSALVLAISVSMSRGYR